MPTAPISAFAATTPRAFASPAGSKATDRQQRYRKPLSSGPAASGWLAASRSPAACAFSPDPATGEPDPAKTKAFLVAHPEDARALALIKKRQVTSGFTNSTFNS